MLAELHVKDLALVEEVWLEFGDGLTALTGETGAGKTVLVGALKLLMGDRADTSLVREGAQEALVEGRFLIDGAEYLVRRRVGADGRSRCSVNGEMATVSSLSALLSDVVDLHGQHEHQALLAVSNHAGYLDRYIGEVAAAAKEQYRSAFQALREARGALASLEASLSDKERRIDYLRFQVSDIDAVAPAPGEDARLEALLPRLRNADRLTKAAAGAWMALRGDEAASDSIARAIAALRTAAGLDGALDDMTVELEGLSAQIDDLGARLREYAEQLEDDPSTLDTVEGRLAAIETLRRKYGPALDDVLAARASAAQELETLGMGEEGLASARAAVLDAEAELRDAAARLSAIRDQAASAFASALAQAAEDLALPEARFDVVRRSLPFDAWTLEGPEKVEFLFSSSAQETPRALAKIASGGEISRVMLALKDVLGGADKTPILVFDEVDAGIGGATARAVGARLASLARTHQVLVVTHLAQVAAYAGHQVVVSRAKSDGRSVTVATPVEGEQRVVEIARMLSGGTSSAGIEHARELLASVRARAAADVPLLD
ncbi:MAG: DNA repair protein RecN [Actinomycetia bacterium]|nr:DNA repair protein RecN [Actinomycetes bacterium]